MGDTPHRLANEASLLTLSGRRPDWTDRSLQRHFRLSFRLGQAHRGVARNHRPVYSQLEAANDLLFGLTLGSALGDVGSGPFVAAHAA